MKSGEGGSPVVLLLTATIDVRGVAFTKRTDPVVRLGDYKRALRAWLGNPRTPPIVFAENSAHPLDELRSIADKENPFRHRVDFLSFDDNSYPRSLGKGFGELRIVRYAMDHSDLIGPGTFVIKVTGRYYVENIEALIRCAELSGEADVFCDLRGNLTWADTRVFCATSAFLRDDFLSMEESIDDSAGVNLEHALGRAVHLAMSRGRRWSMLPRAPHIAGVAGTADVAFSDSWLTRKKREAFRALKAFVLAR